MKVAHFPIGGNSTCLFGKGVLIKASDAKGSVRRLDLDALAMHNNSVLQSP